MRKIIYLGVVACILNACGKDAEEDNQSGNDSKHVIIPSKPINVSYQNPESDHRGDIPPYNDEDNEEDQQLRQKLTKELARALREEVSEFKTVNASNLKQFTKKVKAYVDQHQKDLQGKYYWRQLVSITNDSIENDKFHGDCLGATIDIDCSSPDNFVLFQNLRFLGTKLPYPLSSKNFPIPKKGGEFYKNLDKLVWYDIEPAGLFAVENGMVKLKGEDFFEIDDIEKFSIFFDGFDQSERCCRYFDDSFFADNTIEWLPKPGMVKIYGGKECNIFSDIKNFAKFFLTLNKLGEHFRRKHKIKIILEMSHGKILLNNQEVPQQIWATARFWNVIYCSQDLLEINEPIVVERKGDAVEINHVIIPDLKGDTIFNNNGDIDDLWRKIFKK